MYTASLHQPCHWTNMQEVVQFIMFHRRGAVITRDYYAQRRWFHWGRRGSRGSLMKSPDCNRGLGLDLMWLKRVEKNHKVAAATWQICPGLEIWESEWVKHWTSFRSKWDKTWNGKRSLSVFTSFIWASNRKMKKKSCYPFFHFAFANEYWKKESFFRFPIFGFILKNEWTNDTRILDLQKHVLR